MSQTIDALIHPRWTVTVEPEVRAESGLSVAIDKGRIVEILPREAALGRYRADVEHERPAHVLLPGLINAHCHAGMTLFRGYADDLPLDNWLHDRIWPAESRFVSPQFVADGTRLAIAEMLRGGTTCFADMYYFPDVVAETALETGMRCLVGMIALDFPTPWADTADEYIDKGIAVHDRYRGERLITTAFAPHAPYSVADDLLRRIRRLADELDVPIHTHVHETAQEIEQALETTGQRPLARLAGFGYLSPALMAVHATQLTASEIQALAKAQASVIHCPRSNLKLASGACPVESLLDAGVNVALGTDGAASNNRLDLWAEMDTAALFGKHVAANATALPAESVIRMATINGARAMNLADEIGSIEASKAADLICVELAAPGALPVLNPVSQLVYATSREQVSDVWVAGRHLVECGKLTRLDTGALADTAAAWAGKLVSL